MKLLDVLRGWYCYRVCGSNTQCKLCLCWIEPLLVVGVPAKQVIQQLVVLHFAEYTHQLVLTTLIVLAAGEMQSCGGWLHPWALVALIGSHLTAGYVSSEGFPKPEA